MKLSRKKSRRRIRPENQFHHMYLVESGTVSVCLCRFRHVGMNQQESAMDRIEQERICVEPFGSAHGR
jgi:hypothetical protein